ncbi:MAG: SPOR domain-containing protein [Pseudomonadota bacterium]
MTSTAGFGPVAARGRAPGQWVAAPDPAATVRAYSEIDEDSAFHDGMGETAYSTAPKWGEGFTATVHAVSALGSLALVVWVAVWGYGQVMRDVAGVPVVEALDGPMRAAPDDPGGQVSDMTGFAVNQVKAEGTAAPASEEVRLAPEAPALAEEDVPLTDLEPRPMPDAVTGATEAPPPAAPAPAPAVTEAEGGVIEARLDLDAAPEQPGTPEALASDAADSATTAAVAAAVAEALTEGLAPLDGAPQATGDEVADASDGGVEAVVEGQGPARSVRPMPRPAGSSPALDAGVASRAALRPTAVAPLEPEAGAAGATPVVVEPGMRLVQLGAFDTADEARAAWAEISGRFEALMEGKGLVVQEAQAGGRSFFRLRAAGFEDLSQARRFCAALVAERTDCIPVVAR